MGSAADSTMGVWAWPCLHFLLLVLTNQVCCHLVTDMHKIEKQSKKDEDDDDDERCYSLDHFN